MPAISPVTESKPTIGSFTAEVFAAHLATQKSAPAWWLERKRAAYEKFASLPLPKRTDESWRFSNIGGLTLDGFSLPGSRERERVDSPVAPFGATALTFVNNTVRSDERQRVDLPTGV